MMRKLFLIALVFILSSAGIAQAARFTIDPIADPANPLNPLRVMKGVSLPITALHDAGGALLYKNGSAKNSDLTVGFAPKAKLVFGPGATDPEGVSLYIKTSAVKLMSGTDVEVGKTTATPAKAALLAPVSKTSPLESALLTYSINSLEQRKLAVKTIKLGDMLRGAKIDQYVTVLTGNKGENAASLTNVWIGSKTSSAPIQLMQAVKDKGTGVVSYVPGLYIDPALIDVTTSHTNSKGKLVVDDSTTALRLHGTLGLGIGEDYNAKLKITDKLVHVESNEADYTGDTKAYGDLKIEYTANVGVAKFAQKSPGKYVTPEHSSPMEDFGDPAKLKFGDQKRLTAQIAAGSQLANYDPAHSDNPNLHFSLSSKLLAAGTLAEKSKDPTKPKDGDILPENVNAVVYSIDAKGNYKIANSAKTGNPLLKNLFKGVGSEAKIVSSYYAGTGTSPGGDVSMQWRTRTAAEAHNLIGKKPSDLPKDESIQSPAWLVSDVVKINGTALTNDVYYALQMTFDNRINLAFDGQTGGTIDKEWRNLFIGQLNGTGDSAKWGTQVDLNDPTKRHYKSTLIGGGGEDGVTLDSFLTASLAEGKTLDELVGNWGVEAATQTSWAIVRGGGIFAVVPEPTAILMLVSATLGAMTYGWRRFSRKGELTA